MRVNVYAEEMTDRLEIITKTIDGVQFTGLRFYLELPATTYRYAVGTPMRVNASELEFREAVQVKAPFVHHPGDDDSAAVTFWGKRDLRKTLRDALALLDKHYAERGE